MEKPEKEGGDRGASQLANIEIDPDEPTYCLCDQVSYGEMIGCDNNLWPIEWFHFGCVQLQGNRKGKWFCPKCERGQTHSHETKSSIFKGTRKIQ